MPLVSPFCVLPICIEPLLSHACVCCISLIFLTSYLIQVHFYFTFFVLLLDMILLTNTIHTLLITTLPWQFGINCSPLLLETTSLWTSQWKTVSFLYCLFSTMSYFSCLPWILVLSSHLLLGCPLLFFPGVTN